MIQTTVTVTEGELLFAAVATESIRQFSIQPVEGNSQCLFCLFINYLQDVSEGAGKLRRETRAGGNLLSEEGEEGNSGWCWVTVGNSG